MEYPMKIINDMVSLQAKIVEQLLASGLAEDLAQFLAQETMHLVLSSDVADEKYKSAYAEFR